MNTQQQQQNRNYQINPILGLELETFLLDIMCNKNINFRDNSIVEDGEASNLSLALSRLATTHGSGLFMSPRLSSSAYDGTENDASLSASDSEDCSEQGKFIY